MFQLFIFFFFYFFFIDSPQDAISLGESAARQRIKNLPEQEDFFDSDSGKNMTRGRRARSSFSHTEDIYADNHINGMFKTSQDIVEMYNTNNKHLIMSRVQSAKLPPPFQRRRSSDELVRNKSHLQRPLHMENPRRREIWMESDNRIRSLCQNADNEISRRRPIQEKMRKLKLAGLRQYDSVDAADIHSEKVPSHKYVDSRCLDGTQSDQTNSPVNWNFLNPHVSFFQKADTESVESDESGTVRRKSFEDRVKYEGEKNREFVQQKEDILTQRRGSRTLEDIEEERRRSIKHKKESKWVIPSMMIQQPTIDLPDAGYCLVIS